MKRVLLLLVPVLVPVLAFQLMPLLSSLPANYLSILFLFPYLVLATCIFLAWRFNRSRLFFSSLLIVLVYAAVISSYELQDQTQQWVILLVSLLFPFNILLLGLFKERGIFTQYGLMRFAILGGQGAVAWWLVREQNGEWLEALLFPWIDYPAFVETQSGISQLAWLLTLGVSIWLVIKLVINSKLLESCVLAALALLMLAISNYVDTSGKFLFFGLSGVLLLVTLIQDSYGMAYIDELTGLPGRRALMNTLMSMGKHYSVAMLDIDHFKKFNDTHGHDVGDQVLRKVAAQIAKVGGGGRPARYGGEEFTVVFPGKDKAEAIPHLELVRQNIENDLFSLRGKDRPRKAPKSGATSRKSRKPSIKQLQVTISIGVAERTEKLATTDAVMKAADKALYRAKKKGRNQVCK